MTSGYEPGYVLGMNEPFVPRGIFLRRNECLNCCLKAAAKHDEAEIVFVLSG